METYQLCFIAWVIVCILILLYYINIYKPEEDKTGPTFMALCAILAPLIGRGYLNK